MAAQGWNPTRQTQHPTLFILIITVHVITIITKKIFDQQNPHQFVYQPPQMIIIIIDMIITVFIILIDMSTLDNILSEKTKPSSPDYYDQHDDQQLHQCGRSGELADGRLVCVPDHLFGSHLNHYHPDDPFSFFKLF